MYLNDMDMNEIDGGMEEKNFILEVIQYCDLHPMPACHRELATWMNEQERLAIAYRRCIP
jgi:hypothetical protein